MSKKNRLEDIGELKLNFDNPTHEETLEHQRMADEIVLQRELVARYPEQFDSKPSRYSLVEAKRLLHAADNVYDDSTRMQWLRLAGYTRVCVKGSERRVPLDCADIRNVRAMYKTELAEVQ